MIATNATIAPTNPRFQRPTGVERTFNRIVGWVIGLGGGSSYHRVLEVKGRKSGKLYRTPVNLMEHAGRSYLVAPRGRTAWVQNADAAGEITLLRGRHRSRHTLRSLPPVERPQVLSEYLSRYATAVKGYFSVAPGASPAEFASVAEHHPVYEVSSPLPPSGPLNK